MNINIECNSLLEELNLLVQTYRYREALEVSDCILSQCGPDKNHLFYRSIWLHKVGRNSEALSSIQKAFDLDLVDPLAKVLKAKLLLANRLLSECIEYCEQSFTDNPAVFGRIKGDALKRSGDYGGALNWTYKLLYRADSQTASNIHLFLKLAAKSVNGIESILEVARHIGHKFPMYNSWANQELWYQGAARNSLQKVLESEKSRLAAPRVMNALYLLGDEEHEELWRWHKLAADAITLQNQKKLSTYKHKKIRIGFLSSDLRRHSVAYFLKPIYEYVDKDKYEIYSYYVNEDPDEETPYFEEKSTKFWFAGTMTDDELLNCIRADEVDILIDLNGWTAGNRLTVFSKRAAPVQVSWLGYPATTAINNIDYRIVDFDTDPIDTKEIYAEKLIRMNRLFIAYLPPLVPKVAPALNKNIVFGCFNTLSKINEELIKTWAQLLIEIEDSELVLKTKGTDSLMVRARIKKMFELNEVDPNRIKFINSDKEQLSHLNQYNLIDIALDTFPYSGTTTTCEALIMGVPTLTMVGQSHRSRVSYAILKSIGLEELCFKPEDFIEGVVQLCADNERLNKIKSGLRERVSSSTLCDGKDFAKAWLSIINRLSISVIGDEEKQPAICARGGNPDDSVSC